MVGPQAYHETLPSSLGTKGTGGLGLSELVDLQLLHCCVCLCAKHPNGRKIREIGNLQAQ
jgi:hypothetical protein